MSCVAGSCLSAICFSFGQLPAIEAAINGQKGAQTPATETPEDTLARFNQWRLEALATSNRLESSTVPPSIDEGESDLRRRNLEQLVLLLNRASKNITAAEDARKALADSKSAAKAWTGFPEPPPYSLLMVDELVSEQFLTDSALKSAQASLVNLEQLLATTLSEVQAAEGKVNSGINAVKEAQQEPDAAKWQLDAALEALRLLGVRASVIEANAAIQKDRISALSVDLALIERKVKTAKAKSSLTENDLAQINKLSAERKAGLQKEMTAVSKRLKAASANREQAQSEVTQLSAKPETAVEVLELAKFRLRVVEDRIDALQSVAESYEGLVQLENSFAQSYTNRSLLIRAKNPAERAERIQALEQIRERLQAWISVTTGDITDTSADLSKLESRATSIGAGDAVFPLVNEQRAAKSEKLTMLQRLSKSAVLQRSLVTRWLDEYAPEAAQKGLRMGAEALAFNSWNAVKRVWTYKLTTFNNPVEIDGEIRVGKAPVTVGMVLGAILFFTLGYFIVSRIANRLQQAMVHRKLVAQAQAKTLKNWLMLVAVFFLVIGTFSLLKIPLTAFAFLGGALAIGLGFGMQTLIKNFICGIILLFERKVRVGDLLEVDGFIGRVVEINTRSSIIRNTDDMETLVPNSLFLENRVTNWTLSSSKVRRTLKVLVAHGTSPQSVLDVLQEAASRHGLLCKDPAPYAVFEEFGEKCLVFHLYYWLDLAGAANGAIVASDLRLMTEKRFEEQGIKSPTPF